MTVHKLNWIIFITVVLFVGFSYASSRVKCLKDKELGSRYPNNVYYCDNPKKPECCEEDDEHTCCEQNDEKTMREQLQLWGALALVLVVIAVVIICWRKDTYMCEGDTLKERCSSCWRGKCRKRRKEDDDVIKIRVSRKYRKDVDTPSSDNRPHTAISTFNIDPAFGGADSLQSDVDSGRGSVTSSSPMHNSNGSQIRDVYGNDIPINDNGPISTVNQNVPFASFKAPPPQNHGHLPPSYEESLNVVQAIDTIESNSYSTKRRRKKKNIEMDADGPIGGSSQLHQNVEMDSADLMGGNSQTHQNIEIDAGIPTGGNSQLVDEHNEIEEAHTTESKRRNKKKKKKKASSIEVENEGEEMQEYQSKRNKKKKKKGKKSKKQDDDVDML